MKSRPRLGGPSRCDRGEEYVRLGPRGSEAVRTTPRRGSSLSLFKVGFERSRRSGRGGWLRTELARVVMVGRVVKFGGGGFGGGEVLGGTKVGRT